MTTETQAERPPDQEATPATIDAAPREGQEVLHNGKTFTTIREGLAHILIPADAPTTLDTKKYQKAQKEKTSLPAQSVFYNPIQQFNRDLSVLALRAYSEHVTAIREQKARKGKERKDRKRKRREENEADSSPQNGPSETQCQTETTQKQSVGTKSGIDGAYNQENENARPEKKLKATQFEPDESANEVTTAEEVANGAQSVTNGETVNHAGRRSEFKILDALSATGLRALRYAQEIPVASSITANDLSPGATESIKVNVEHNRLTEKIAINTGNALSHMYSFVGKEGGKYDVIDLDPYGTAVPFFDAAIQALNDGGLLCVTCTDAGVWASHGYAEKTFSLYGGNPIKGRHSHEGGLRLILNSIATTAARYGIAIEPLMSLSIDFYARVFVRIRKSPEQVKFLAGKTMLVYSCDSGCGAFKTQLVGKNDPFKNKEGQTLYKHGMAQAPSCGPHCDHCGFKLHLSGPMWAGPLHNPTFLERLLEYVPQLEKSTYGTKARIEGMVSTALEETLVEDYPEPQQSKDEITEDDRIIPCMHPISMDRHPFCFRTPVLAGVIHCQAPGEALIRGALRHAGFRAVRSHTQPGSIRTDAPWEFIWEMMREWVRQEAPLKEGALKPATAGYGIMERGKGKQNQGQDTGAEQPSPGNGEDRPITGDSGADGISLDKQRIVFDESLGREKQKRRLVRYQENPRENWGPMNRAR